MGSFDVCRKDFIFAYKYVAPLRISFRIFSELNYLAVAVLVACSYNY